MANPQPIRAPASDESHPTVFKHMWGDRRGKNIEILDKNRKQQHVMSICTISALAADFLTLPGWRRCFCQVHPSISASACQASRERQKTATHSLRSYAKSWKVEKNVKRKNAKRKRGTDTFSSPFLNNSYLFNSFTWLKLSPRLRLWLQILTPGCVRSKC